MQFFKTLAILAMGISVSAIPLGPQQHGTVAAANKAGHAKAGNCVCPPRRGGLSKNRSARLSARTDDDNTPQGFQCPNCHHNSHFCDDG